jgi:RNA polymerase sigma-70 factor (ECF subfamily)
MPASLPAGERELHEGRSLAAAAEAHLDDVYRYVLYLTGDRDLAEDLTSETFERALRRWRRFDSRRGSAKTWLCQLARGAALDHFRAEERRRRREQTYAATEPRDAEPVYGEGLSPALEKAVAALSAAEREVVALRVVLELDGEATARVLGISPSACSTRLSRALNKLQEGVGSDVRA